MPTTTGSTLAAKAKLIAQDPAGIRWTDAEWLSYVNDAQKAIVGMKPQAYVRLASQALVVGSRQVLPADGIAFLDITRNMGSGGTTPGATPRRVSRAAMNAQNPSWQTDTATAVVANFMAESEMPTIFFVYPPSTGTGQVEVEYVALPADLTALTDVIKLDDRYALPMLDYMLYKAYLKDMETPANAERALFHMKQCETQLGVGAKA